MTLCVWKVKFIALQAAIEARSVFINNVVCPLLLQYVIIVFKFQMYLKVIFYIAAGPAGRPVGSPSSQSSLDLTTNQLSA